MQFVELTDTTRSRVPKPRSSTASYSATSSLLDPREREVIVRLRNGTTNLTEIADIMGYRNHSPISKRLKNIRDTAARFFEADNYPTSQARLRPDGVRTTAKADSGLSASSRLAAC